MAALPQRPLGSSGLTCGAQGLGCMGMSYAYTTGKVEESEYLATIEKGKQLGVTMLDTSDMYGWGENEKLVGKAIAGDKRKDYVLATKFANMMNDDGSWGVRGDAEYVREACEKSLQRLGTDHIDLYYMHRKDKKVLIEETVKAMAELVKEGKVKYIGLSEVGPEDIRKANAVHPITAVQLEWSLWTREVENDVIPVLRELGIGIVAYSPLGRGFLTGQLKSRDDLAEDDGRRHHPRFSAENFDKNLELVKKVEEIAAKKDCKPGQVALAWLHAQGQDVFPIPGTKKAERIEENAGAFKVKLTAEDMKALDEAFPHDIAVGERYPEQHMANVHDSRKKK